MHVYVNLHTYIYIYTHTLVTLDLRTTPSHVRNTQSIKDSRHTVGHGAWTFGGRCFGSDRGMQKWQGSMNVTQIVPILASSFQVFFFFFSGLKYVEFHPSEGTTMFERAMVLISTCGKLKDNWISSFFRCHGNEFMEAVMLLRRSTSCNMPCPWKINRDSNHLEHVLEFIRLLVGTLVLPSPIKIARTSGSTGYLVAT